MFSLTTGKIKQLLSITRNKKKKHDKILMFAKSKLNTIETLVSQALSDMEISHEGFITILNVEDKYEKMKENVKNLSEKQENMRLSNVNSRSSKKENTRLQMIYISIDFNWLEGAWILSEKQQKIIKHFTSSKKMFFLYV